MDLLIHVLLFTAVSLVIVVMGSFYSEPANDLRALRAVPRRLLIFVLSCAAVAIVMLVCEMLFASVS